VIWLSQGEDAAGTGQDGLPDGKMNPTIWTAKARATDPKRRHVTGEEKRRRQMATRVCTPVESAANQPQGNAAIHLASSARRGLSAACETALKSELLAPEGAALRRGATMSRWGGLGQHRYQIGFSGDVASLTWSNLAYQVRRHLVPLPSWPRDLCHFSSRAHRTMPQTQNEEQAWSSVQAEPFSIESTTAHAFTHPFGVGLFQRDCC